MPLKEKVMMLLKALPAAACCFIIHTDAFYCLGDGRTMGGWGGGGSFLLQSF